jgi:hypothetical protein
MHNSSPIALRSAGFAWYQIRGGDERESQSNEKKSLHRGILSANKGWPPSIPKFGFRSLHATTTCGSRGGSGFVACWRCGVPTMIGLMQSTVMPAPALSPLGTKPACVQAALICAHGCQGT